MYYENKTKHKNHTQQSMEDNPPPPPRKTSCRRRCRSNFLNKIVMDYDQEIPQSQTAGKPMAPRGRATQQSRDARKTN